MRSELKLIIDVNHQILECWRDGKKQREYLISTATKGAGQIRGSEQTPLGRHCVRAKIGANAPSGTVFVSRRPSGEIYTPELGEKHPARDWILTRILWLSGLEIGHNRLGKVDTMQRYIYIHGTAEEDKLGTPASHGCIRMANQDVIELFEQTPVGTVVEIIS